MTIYFNLSVTVNPNADDCFAAARREVLARFPTLEGYTLDARWADDEDREVILVSVPAWAIINMIHASSSETASSYRGAIEAIKRKDIDEAKMCLRNALLYDRDNRSAHTALLALEGLRP